MNYLSLSIAIGCIVNLIVSLANTIYDYRLEKKNENIVEFTLGDLGAMNSAYQNLTEDNNERIKLAGTINRTEDVD